MRALRPLLIGLAAGASIASAVAGPLTGAERRSAVERIATLMHERFYDPSRLDTCLAPMRAAVARGDYDRIDDPDAFAAALTRVLGLCGDHHLRISYSPAGPAPTPVATPTPPQEDLAAQYRRRNYDFRELRLLEGNVGYLRLYTFAPARMAGETAAAAMRFLAGTDAVIIDLRGNRGGYPDMGLLIASYFFERSTHYATVYRRVGDRTEQQWTLPFVPGPRLAAQDLYILVGRDSFSGGESLAYNLQALGRATVIGERTLGGATGGNTVRVDERFEAFISDVNFTNPVSKSNWEANGVVPDIATGYEEALTVAHRTALAKLAGKASDPVVKRSLEWSAELIAARASPPAGAEDLDGLAGSYGSRVVTRSGAGLLYRNGDNAVFRLTRVGRDEYLLEGEPIARFRFVRGADGRAARLIGLYIDGSSLDFARNAP